MPALLTSMVGSPSWASRSATSACRRFRSRGVVDRPASAQAALLEPGADRRRARGRGRGADHRCAGARERQRDGLPDAARRAGDQRHLCLCHQCLLPAASMAACSEASSSIAMQLTSGRRSMRRLSAVSTLPGPHSTSSVAPRARQRQHGCRPAHRARQLPLEYRANALRRAMFRGIDGAEPAQRRRADRGRRQPLAELRRGAPQQRGMRRHAHRQQQRALGAARLGRGHRPLDGARVTGDDDLPGRVVVHGLDHLALRGLRAGGLGSRVFEPEDRRHRALARGHRRLHGAAAFAHQRDGAAKFQRAGADQRGKFTEAVPGHQFAATAHRPACQARQVATPATSIAGCVHSVLLSCSAGPCAVSSQRS